MYSPFLVAVVSENRGDNKLFFIFFVTKINVSIRTNVTFPDNRINEMTFLKTKIQSSLLDVHRSL